MNKFEMKERIKEKPYYVGWTNESGADCLRSDGDINYDGLTDAEKFILYCYAWNISGGICVGRKSVMRYFKWTAYKVGKLFKELKQQKKIECVATFSEDTGLLAGRGYEVNI